MHNEMVIIMRWCIVPIRIKESMNILYPTTNKRQRLYSINGNDDSYSKYYKVLQITKYAAISYGEIYWKQPFWFTEINLKMCFTKCQPLCSGLYILNNTLLISAARLNTLHMPIERVCMCIWFAASSFATAVSAQAPLLSNRISVIHGSRIN